METRTQWQNLWKFIGWTFTGTYSRGMSRVRLETGRMRVLARFTSHVWQNSRSQCSSSLKLECLAGNRKEY